MEDRELSPPAETYPRLFLRFLRFGTVAWGGPVAQIGLLRHQLVDEERWVSSRRFNRVLAVYQVLPGPEATELCVFFGYLARGRLGGLVAGLGFVLPGLILMLLLSWAYVRFGLAALAPAGVFYGLQAAVLALIVRAVHRIGRHALHDGWLWGVGAAALAADLFGVHFGVILASAGMGYALVRRGHPLVAAGALGLVAAIVVLLPALRAADPVLATAVEGPPGSPPGLMRLFWVGLLAGLLTFGGAYTVIPFLQRLAVGPGGWMTNAQFLDGIALGGVLPAPLVIFGALVGYVGGGLPGALLMTLGIFLPAFAVTILGHPLLEGLVAEPRLHAFFDGVTAAVVGLIVGTALELAPTSVPDLPAALIATLALTALYRWTARAAVPVVVAGAGILGMLVVRL
jgi:chromate transporter